MRLAAVAFLICAFALVAGAADVGSHPAAHENVIIGGGYSDADGGVDIDSEGNADFAGDVAAGTDGAGRGTITLWDGSGGNQPGYVRIATPDGTTYYLFMADDGTLRYHTSAPTANGDGSQVSSTSSTFDADGIDINPGSDIDADLISVGVTGTPTFKWDESEDAFGSTHDLTFSAAFPQVFTQQGYLRLQPYAASGTVYLRLAPDARDNSGSQYIYLFDNSCGTGPGYLIIYEPGTTNVMLRLAADTGNLEARGSYTFLGLDDGSNETNYAVMTKAITDTTNGAEKGELLIQVQDGSGSVAEALRVHDDLHIECKDDVTIGGDLTVTGTMTGTLAATVAHLNVAETVAADWVNTAYPWLDAEVADTLTIDASSSVADGALSANIPLLDAASTITGNWVNTTNPWADGEVVDALTISGGTVNNSVIGGSTPAAGTFTTLSTTDDMNIATGKVYKINGTQITTAALSDESDIVKSLTLDADTGTPSTVNDGDTVTIAGGADIATSVSGDTVTVAYTGSGGRSASDGPYFVTHYLGATLPSECTASASGTGTAVGFVTGVGGKYRLTSGTTTPTAAAHYIASSTSYKPWSGSKNVVLNIQMDSEAITDTGSYIVVGLTNSGFLADDDAYFILTKGTNSDQWVCISENENATESTNTTEGYTSEALYTIEITSSSVVFKIDDATVATHTTQVPDEAMYANVLVSQAGNPGTSFDVDLSYSEMEQEL